MINPPANPFPRQHGMTLVEIMIVVSIVGLLAIIAVPTAMRNLDRTRNTAFINDLRVAVAAFEQYALECGSFPPDRTPSVIPPGMDEFLRKIDWDGTNSIGGRWDWDYQQFGYKAGVSVYKPNRSEDHMALIDEDIDDGDLTTGNFRQRADGYIYIIEF